MMRELFFCAMVLSVSVSAAADVLVVSNDPERVTGPSGLFLHSADVGKTVRLLYHHKNVSTVPLVFVISVRAASQGTLQVLRAAAGPAPDEVFTGHQAMFRYWRQVREKWTRHSVGTVETVLLHILVAPNEVVSGVFEYVSDVETVCEGRALDPQFLSASYALIGSQDQTGHVYPAARTEQLSYRVGGLIQELQVGGMPFVSNTDGTVFLRGNYGVCYSLDAKLENPDVVSRDVQLLFVPLGGISRAIVRLNRDRLVESGNVGGTGFPAVSELFRLTLAPGEIRDVRLDLMPQAGSYYPVHIVFRSVNSPVGFGKTSSVFGPAISKNLSRLEPLYDNR